MRSQSFKKDYFWNTIGVFAQNAISPFLLVVVTRINGIFDSGIFSFAFSLSIIFWALGMWGGRTYQVSDVRRKFAHRSYVMVRLLLAIVMLVAGMLFSLINQYDATKTGIIMALVGFKVVESIADALYGVLQSNNRLYIVGRSLLIKAILGSVAFIVIDYVLHDILLGCVAIVGMNLLVVLIYDLPKIRQDESIGIQGDEVWHYITEASVIIKRCTPIAVVIFLTMFSLNIPRYFLDRFHEDQVGVFGVIAMPITLVALVITFILQPNVVQLSKMFNDRRINDFHRIVMKLTCIAATLGVFSLLATFLIGVPVLDIIFGFNFEPYKVSLIVIVIGAVANAIVSVYINILTIMRRFKAQFYILLLTNVALASVSAVIVKAGGLLAGVTLFTIINFIQLFFFMTVYIALLKKERKYV